MTYTAEDFGTGASFWESEFDEPLPGHPAGSWIPTPPPWVFPNAPPLEPFDTPAGDGGPVAPGFGEAHGAAELFGAASIAQAEMERQIQPMGLSDLEGDNMENSFGTLGAEAWYTQIAKAAAQIGLGLAQKSGLIEAPELEPDPVATIVEEQLPPPPPRPNYMPLVVVGGGLLLFMMMGRRR